MESKKTTIAVFKTTLEELERAKSELFLKGRKFNSYNDMILEFETYYMEEVAKDGIRPTDSKAEGNNV